MTLEEYIASLEAKKKELRQKVVASQQADEVRSINAQLLALDEQLDNLRGIKPTAPGAPAATPPAPPVDPKDPQAEQKRGKESAVQTPEGGFDPLASFGGEQERSGAPTVVTDATREKAYRDMCEKRGKDMRSGDPVHFTAKEMHLARSITISGGGIIVPSQFSNALNPTFGQVSSLVDLVHGVPLPGGESYTKGYQMPVPNSADYTDENPTAGYVETDSAFGQVSINKTKITAYSEFSEEIKKLPNVDYQARIASDVRIALRRKISREIVVGDGAANHFVGIYHAPVAVMPANYAVSLSSIDEKTLDSIVFAYGGEEDVEAPTWIILTKEDLAAFAAVRNAFGLPFYKITRDNVNGNTGTISSNDAYSVNYVINSACNSLTGQATAGTNTMLYGILQDYEMPVFSDIDIQVSTDFKFGSGMICYRGSVYSGGNVAAWKGFMPVQYKPAS